MNDPHGMCLTSVRIVHKINRQPFCLSCFDKMSIDSSNYVLKIAHCFTYVKGPYDLCLCTICGKNLSISRPRVECSRCSEKLLDLTSETPIDEIVLSNLAFRFDIFTDSYEGLSLNEPCQNTKF